MRSVSSSPLVYITKLLDWFVWSDIANTPQLQSSWRRLLWLYRSPQDASAGHGRSHGDNPWKFRYDVSVWGIEVLLSFVKAIGNEKESWVSHYGVVYKVNLISNLSRTSDWSTNSGSSFFQIDWDLCGEYRQPIAHVDGPKIYSPRLGQSNWPINMSSSATNGQPYIWVFCPDELYPALVGKPSYISNCTWGNACSPYCVDSFDKT